MPLPTCTRCNFEWVRMDLEFTRDEQLCDTCMNQCLGKSWSACGRVFSTELDAMSFKYSPNPVLMTPQGKIITPKRPPAVKKPILTKKGRLPKVPENSMLLAMHGLPSSDIIDLVSDDEI